MLPPDPQRRRPDGQVAPHYRWLKTIGIANPLHGPVAAGVGRLERDFGDGTSYICRGCDWCECTSLALLQAPSIVWTFTGRTRDDTHTTMFVTFVGLTTQVVRSNIWSISRISYLKKGYKLYLVTPSAWHDFCKITQWCPCCAHSFVPNNRTRLNNKGSKMAALRQIAFDGKGYPQSPKCTRPNWTRVGNIDGSIALAWPFPQPSFNAVAVAFADYDAAADAVNPAASDRSSGTQRCSRTTTSSTSSRRQVSISAGARSQNIAER
ncbi:hypothetical protein ACVJMZ_005913 [Sinorhizobium medicae]